MSKTLKRLVTGLYTLLVAAALTFGASQALASSANECLGTCPPLDDRTCWDACVEAGFVGGDCVGSCCFCLE
jgi:hypothetical protein